MGKFFLSETDYTDIDRGDSKTTLVKKDSFNSFNETTLGLGDLSIESEPTNAIAAIFDLAGFTAFCNQTDPHLVVPEFLNSFLKWIYSKIRQVSVVEEHAEGFELWCNFPFYSKFLGDGLLLLWDTKDITTDELGNIIVTLKEICDLYSSEFFEDLSESYSYPPNKLRCGIARGVVYNVGNNNDYVGPCINIASRLQKIAGLTFCFSRRGIDLKKCLSQGWLDEIMVKKTNIRGIGDDELICFFKKEYDALSAENKNLLA